MINTRMFDTTRLFGNRAKASLSPWTVAAYFLAAILFFLLVEAIIRNNTHIKEMAVERLLLEKTTAIQETIDKYFYKTHTLAALVVQKESDYNFEEVAAAVIDSDLIQNITIAPDGIVTQVYPREGNEASLGLDYSREGPGNREAIMARELDDLVMAGPFPLIQGGTGLVGRLPVWRDDASGDRQFWGIVSITLKYPDVIRAAGLDDITAAGLDYELWRVNPEDGTMQTIAGTQNIGKDTSFIEWTMSLYSADWHLRIGPTYLWYKDPINWALMVVGLLGSFLIASLVQSNHALTLVKGNMEFQEKALRQAVIKAQEASRMKSTFLATMSHEIRTPMNGIVGYSELAMDHVGADSETRNYLLKIKDSAQGLLGIINDILDISKIETGRLELECIAFSLDDVLRICQTISNPKAMEKGIDLRFPTDILEHPIKGDPTKLRQAVLNLVANAIKFTHKGSVTVDVTTVERTDESTTLRFSVADTGIGMNEEQVQHIFTPFSQADSGITRKYGGTGLGLAITKSIVDSMGGKLEVTSQPNQGSEFHFTITFPNASPDELPEMEQKCSVRRPLFKGEVLVAEDNAIN
ncbi:MAG: ATP-binding protein [Planctomycetaceae bacterium]|nr:ATP-binding protein [Planctomycetaceae bacterium]